MRLMKLFLFSHVDTKLGLRCRTFFMSRRLIRNYYIWHRQMTLGAVSRPDEGFTGRRGHHDAGGAAGVGEDVQGVADGGIGGGGDEGGHVGVLCLRNGPVLEGLRKEVVESSFRG
jgi:hypothetical protein